MAWVFNPENGTYYDSSDPSHQLYDYGRGWDGSAWTQQYFDPTTGQTIWGDPNAQDGAQLTPDQITQKILRNESVSQEDFVRWFESSSGYNRPYQGESMQSIYSGLQTQNQQALVNDKGALEEQLVMAAVSAFLGAAGAFPSLGEIGGSFMDSLGTAGSMGIDSGIFADAAGNLYNPDPSSLASSGGALSGGVTDASLGELGINTDLTTTGGAFAGYEPYADPFGNYATFNSGGAIETYTDASGNVATYDANGGMLSYRDVAGNVQTYDPSTGQITQYTDAAGNIARFNADGEMLSYQPVGGEAVSTTGGALTDNVQVADASSVTGTASDVTAVDQPYGIDSGQYEDAAGNVYDAGSALTETDIPRITITGEAGSAVPVAAAATAAATLGSGGGGMDPTDIIEEVGNFTGGGDDSTLSSWGTDETTAWNPDELPGGAGAASGGTTTGSPKTFFDLLKNLISGDVSAIKDLLGMGLPLALLAGLLEKNQNPLAEQLKAAAEGALSATQQFAALPTPGITSSQQRAIDLANSGVGDWQQYLDKSGALTDESATLARSNIGDWQALLEKAGLTADQAKALAEQYQGGWQPYLDQAGALGTEAADAARRTQTQSQDYFDRAGAFGDEAAALARSREGGWQPYLDRAGALADKAAGGIPGMDLNAYMNPYLAAALQPAQREIERAAAKKRISENARAGMKSAFGGGRHALERGILDRNEMEEIGDLYHRGLSAGYDRATGLMTSDLSRMLQSGQLFSSMAGQYGNLSAAEVTNLMRLMEQFRGMGDSAGALGSRDVSNLLASGKFFSDLGGQYGSLGNIDVSNLLKLSGEYGDQASRTGALGTTDVANLLKIGGEYGDLATQTGSLNTGDVTNLTRAGELERQPYTDQRTQLADTAKLYTSIIPDTTSANTALQEPSMLGQITGALGAYSSARDLGIVP